jgi:hypothetical protein
MIAIDGLLLGVYLVLLFTVFKTPTYVPFASKGISTLVPEGDYTTSKDGAWERHRFDGKGTLEISVRRIGTFELSDIVQSRSGRAESDVELRDLVRQHRGPGAADEADELSELVKRALEDSAVGRETGDSGAGERTRMDAGRTYIQLLASNTPNLRLLEEVPAFDSTIFCLGSIGRGERRYRYLVHSEDLVVDMHMHSRNSSHLVFKEILDTALQNLRIDGSGSNHLLAQALLNLSGKISPRYAQGNIFWLVFFIALPTGIMLLLLPFQVMRARREATFRSDAP